jgi:hypothetical protein
MGFMIAERRESSPRNKEIGRREVRRIWGQAMGSRRTHRLLTYCTHCRILKVSHESQAAHM